MRAVIYIWTAIVLYRWIKLMVGGGYGSSGNIICDFLCLLYTGLAMYVSALDEDLMGIIVHLIICFGLFWATWKITKKDLQEGKAKGIDVAEGLLAAIHWIHKNIAVICGMAILITIVAVAVSFNDGNTQSNAPVSRPSTTQQTDTQTKPKDEDDKKYADRIPFAGMDEKYIGKTAAGPYTKKEERNGWTYYYWCIGDYTVLTVRVSETIDYQMSYSYDSTIKLHNVVSEVKQDFLSVAWTYKSNYLPYRIKDRQYEYAYLKMPKFGPYYDGKKVTESDIRQYLANQRNNNHSSTSSSSYNYDDPDGYGYYDDFEDFYNDHYDDFDSYQEAEEYFDTYY